MIDFIKAILPSKYSQILSGNQYLKFERTADEQTGEVVQRIATYRNLKFDFKSSGIIIMTGSLHKFFNGGEHNHNDFAIQDLISALQLIASNLRIDLIESKIQNIEFGVNITPPLPVKLLLRGLLLHTGLGMPMEVFKNVSLTSGDYRQVKRNRFYLKAYDKGKHYNLGTNLFRWEVKITKMVEIEHLGIYSLSDLMKLSRRQIEGINSLLVSRWNEVLYYDNTINKSLLADVDKIKFKDWENVNYWIRLYEDSRSSNKNKFSREVNKFRKTSNKISKLIQNNISDLISEKWGALTDLGVCQLGSINSSNIELNLTSNTSARTCKVTGVDISMQKDDSALLSHSGLYYLLENDNMLFEELKAEYLSIIWYGLSTRIQIKELAHNIRNVQNNQKIKERRMYPMSQVNLLTQFGLQTHREIRYLST